MQTSKLVLALTGIFGISSLFFSNTAIAQHTNITREDLVRGVVQRRCQAEIRLDRYSAWDLQRRYLRGDWCLEYASKTEERRSMYSSSPVQQRTQWFYIDTITFDGLYLTMHNYWNFSYTENISTRRLEPMIFQTQKIKIIQFHVPESLNDFLGSAFGSSRDVVILEASITPSGTITKYETGNSLLAEKYNSEIREGLSILRQYSLPLNTPPF
jgi:hypothetical protein